MKPLKKKKADNILEFIKKRNIMHNRRGLGGSLVCSAAMRYQLEYASALGCRTETVEESPEEK